MRAILFALLVGIVPGLSRDAEAAQMGRSIQIGNWTLGAYSNNNTRKFSHCAATAPYRSGVTLLFIVSRDYEWGVGFLSQEFDMPAKQNIRLGIALDESDFEIVQAYVIDRNFARIDLASNSDLYKRFMRSHLLRLRAADKAYSFALQDTSKLLPQLLKCVYDRLNPAPLNAQGPVPQRPVDAPKSTAVVPAAVHAEAMSLAANLLSEAGVSGFRFASPSPEDIAQGTVRWSAPTMDGALIVVMDPAIKRPADQMPKLIELMARECKGKFASGSIPEEGGAARAFTSCQVGTADAAVGYYLAMPRSAGGHFVLMTFPRAAATADRAPEPDKDIRTAAYRILK